jgi:cobalt-zinc-cadmium efflux system protein
MTHAHDHAPANFGRAFAIGITLNIGIVLVEAIYGWRAGSLALLAEAGHNLSDVGGLVLAWAGLAAGRWRADDRHTYGWRRGSILASFANAVILLVGMGALAWSAIQRLQTPTPIEGRTVMIVAAIGIAVNAGTAALFAAGRKGDLNIRAAFLHMAADALVSMGVVLSGALYLWRGWRWIDPATSLVIAVLIVGGTWSLFRQSLHLLFDGVPEHLDVAAIRQRLLGLPGVQAMHDLHVWAMGTSEPALSVHLVVDPFTQPADALLRAVGTELHDQFEIVHVTVQLESASFAESCAMRARADPPTPVPGTLRPGAP